MSLKSALLICSCNRNAYDGLNEPQICEVLDAIGKVSCSAAGSLSRKHSEVTTQDTLYCELCDNEQYQDDPVVGHEYPDLEDLWNIFNFVLPKLTRTPGPRIAAMVALRRVLMHSASSNEMHLSSSSCGEFCLHSLRSSNRELRVATGYVVSLHTALP